MLATSSQYQPTPTLLKHVYWDQIWNIPEKYNTDANHNNQVE